MNKSIVRQPWIAKALIIIQVFYVTGCYTANTQLYDQDLSTLSDKEFESLVLINGDSLYFEVNKASLVTLPKRLKGKTAGGEEITVNLSDCKELITSFPSSRGFSAESISKAKEIHLKSGEAIRSNGSGFTYQEKYSLVYCETDAGENISFNSNNIEVIYGSLPDTMDFSSLLDYKTYPLKAALLKSAMIVKFSNEPVIVLPEKICITGKTENSYLEINPEDLVSYTTSEFSFSETTQCILGSYLLFSVIAFIAWIRNGFLY